MLKTDPKIIPIPEEPVQFLFDNGQYKAAKELGLVALQSQPTNVNLANLIAGSYFHLNEYKQAAFFIETMRDKLGFFPVELQMNYALVLYYLRRIDEALIFIEPLWKKVTNPVEETDLGSHYAVLLDHVGRIDEAYAILKQLDSTNNVTLFNLGWHELNRGNFLKGFEHLAHGNKARVWGSEHLYNLPKYKRLKTSTDVKGKIILMANEGGQGDEVIFARFAQILKQRGATVWMGASPHLVSIFQRVPDIEKVGTMKEAIEWDYDFYLPSMNSVNLLQLNSPDVPNFPYIKALPEKVREKDKLMYNSLNQLYHTSHDFMTALARPKIGIRWAGNPMFEHEQFRTLPYRKLLDFTAFGTLFSIQRDEDFGDMRIHDPIIDLRDDLNTWEDTLGYLENFDYLITSCTSITHMAAAMGKKVCLIAPIMPYFPWAQKTQTSIWYPNIQIFYQTNPQSWDEPIQKCFEWIEEDVQYVEIKPWMRI